MHSVMEHSFGMAPSVEMPRSTFNRSHGYKTTFNSGDLIPFFWDEIYPGDTVNLQPTIFCRMNTPIYPLMDNLHLDYHFFFVPYRIIWDNWRKFQGEQDNPSASIDFTIPRVDNGQMANIQVGDVGDYLGLPIGKNIDYVSALPGRAYRKIFNDWYRDQNLSGPTTVNTDDGSPDTATYYEAAPQKRQKRYDYFTSCLPFLQKGDAIDLPLGTQAPVRGIGGTATTGNNSGSITIYDGTSGGQSITDYRNVTNTSTAMDVDGSGNAVVYADLTNATAATVNELRQAFHVQRLLERDARSGTKYSEIIKAHFGVEFLDIAYRPQFLGGGTTMVQMESVAQTSSTDATTPKGDLSAFGYFISQGGGITQSFTEHGILMGIASVRADLTYSQGLDRYWLRRTRYDFYMPVLANLGEQAVLTSEIYAQDKTVDTGSTGTPDNERVFGYNERWSELRYKPSKITGLFRPDVAGTLASWHLSQQFSSTPELGADFIKLDVPMDRVVAVTSEPDFMMDVYFNYQHARVMPLYSIPGLTERF